MNRRLDILADWVQTTSSTWEVDLGNLVHPQVHRRWRAYAGNHSRDTSAPQNSAALGTGRLRRQADFRAPDFPPGRRQHQLMKPVPLDQHGPVIFG